MKNTSKKGLGLPISLNGTVKGKDGFVYGKQNGALLGSSMPSRFSEST
jgi:hypothetical protein